MDTAIQYFYNVLDSFFKVCIPLVKSVRSNRPPWFTRELSILRNIKSRHYKKYKKACCPSDFYMYSVARSNFMVLNTKCYKDYLQRCKLQVSHDPKQFFNFVNTKRKTSIIPSCLSFEGIFYHSPPQKW